MEKNILLLLAIIASYSPAYGVGSFPVPQINDISFNASAAYDPTTKRFEYHYSITSGASNQGDISYIFIDIKRQKSIGFETPPTDFQFSIPSGKTPSLGEMLAFQSRSKLPFGTSIETLSTDLPAQWGSSPTADGYLVLTPPAGGFLDVNGIPSHANLISPGETINNIVITGLSAPTLKEVIIVPDWELIVENHEALTDEVIKQGNQLLDNLMIKTVTIGPGHINYSSGLLNRTIEDIDKMIQLGWITDAPLITTVKNLLVEAKILSENADGTQSKLKLQQSIELMATVTENQMRREASDLIQINIQLVKDNTSDTFIPPDLAFIVTPKESILEIGNKVTFVPQVIDRARNDEPVSEFNIYSLRVLSGPHTGLFIDGVGSDQLGYIGTKTGIDIVEITRKPIQPILELGDDSLYFLVAALDDPDSLFTVKAKVTWTGGADYVISFFSPPYLDYVDAGIIYIYEETKNIGTSDGKIPSTTRYYLSSSSNFDISTAYQLLERSIAPLSIDAESKSGETALEWPAQFPPGRYYFATCADANNEITELNENNNCSFHTVDRVPYVVGVISLDEVEVVNEPPVCDQAVANPNTLWPPNHKFKNITIDGIIDADQDNILIKITAITQDEEVNSIASGNTSPDGKGVGTPFAKLRAERDGTGDGRVYVIHFEAIDTAGNACSGIVNASAVVHDKSQKSSIAIDSGQVYDSTITFN